METGGSGYPHLPTLIPQCLPSPRAGWSAGLWSEPRKWRGAGLGLDGHYPILCSFVGLSFQPGVLLPAGTGVGGAGVGSLGLGLLLVQPGKEPLVSRVRFEYSSLAVLSPLAGGLCRVGTR